MTLKLWACSYIALVSFGTRGLWLSLQNVLKSALVNSTNRPNSTISSGQTPFTPYVKSNPKFDTGWIRPNIYVYFLVELSATDCTFRVWNVLYHKLLRLHSGLFQNATINSDYVPLDIGSASFKYHKPCQHVNFWHISVKLAYQNDEETTRPIR